MEPEIVSDAEVKAALEKYAASQAPMAAPGAVNWALLLPLLQMILPLVLPADLIAKIREWISKILPSS